MDGTNIQQGPRDTVGRRFHHPPFRLSLLTGLIVVAASCLSGCPATLLPELTVSPNALNFGSLATRTSFAVLNTGGSVLTWSVEEVVWSASDEAWVAQDVPWLTVDEEDVSGETTDETDRVFLDVDRTGLSTGAYSGAGVRVVSNAGNAVVAAAMSVVGGTDPGTPTEGKIEASTSEVALNGLDDLGEFQINNVGTASVRWRLEVEVSSPNADANTPVQISVSPTTAVTLPDGSTDVTVQVVDEDSFDTDILSYVISILDSETSELLDQVDVVIELTDTLVEVSVAPTVLDFGEEEYQLTFQVANSGDPFSLLDFGFFLKDKGDDADSEDDDVYVPFDAEDDPLIADIAAAEGTEDVPGHVYSLSIWDVAREVTVTIQRDGLEEDVEYREIYVGAVRGTDVDGDPIFEPDVEPQLIQIRVEAAPYVEGAINRSRPPSIMRFVFMLRDKTGVAIDAADSFIRDQIWFYIEEDDAALDPFESSVFVTGPENLKTNIVLLLDYTGSMYNAGTTDSLNPLEQGEAIQQMVQAAKQFVLSVPDAWRIAVLEYHGRSNEDRVIHGFDTNKAAIIASMDAFSIPASEHGASEMYDAVLDASERIVNQDTGDTLPFDDADSRLVVFMTDGKDTSSVAQLSELTDYAKDNRVRLYPIGFGGRISNPVNNVPLLELANETGGHLYYAADAAGLTALLDTENALSFDKTSVSLDVRQATLRLRNNGTSSLTWQAIESLDWVTMAPSSGTVPALTTTPEGVIDEPGVREATLSLSLSLAPGTYEGDVTIASNYGDATLSVTAVVDVGGNLTRFTVVPKTDDNGRLVNELLGQVVLTYTSLFQDGTHAYSVNAYFPDLEGDETSAHFEKDGVFWPGDERAGQISLHTTGVSDGKAEVYVRADYVPRSITVFRFRFIISVPEELTPNLTAAERLALHDRLVSELNNGAVTIVSDGPMKVWRPLPVEESPTGGVHAFVSEDVLTFGEFGDLLKIEFEGLGSDEAFTLGLRVDNREYYSPGTATTTSTTKYFLYPGGRLNPDAVLEVSGDADLASPARTPSDFLLEFDPEADPDWDRDEDGWADFDDSVPDDPDLGDDDGDGVPDLDDATPLG